MTKTGKVAMLNKLNPGPFVEIHPEDAATLGIKARDPVEIRSRRGRAVLPAVVTERVQAGNCFAPMHWNDVFGDDLCINAVTSDSIDPVSQQPELKFCAVALSPVALDAIAPASNADDGTRIEAPAVGADAATTASAISTNTKDLDMPRINALTSLLQLPQAPAPSFTETERAYLGGFVSGLRSAEGQGIDSVPVLPAGAPFDPANRLYVDGLLAGLYSRSATLAVALAGALAASHSDAAHASGVRILRVRPKVTLLWASQTGNTESLTDVMPRV
jgi:Uncharacterized anaerobic dehydrogenase